MPTLLEKPVTRKELARYEEPTLNLRDPMRMFDWMRDEMDRLLDTIPFNRVFPVARAETPWIPVLEVFEKLGALHIKADLPGLKKEDVTIEATPEGLTISGERKFEVAETKKEEGYFRSERVYGEFKRFVPLPEGAVIDKIAASFTDGVLEVIVPIPKAEKVVPQKVNIK
jgi:HSP20 family protein